MSNYEYEILFTRKEDPEKDLKTEKSAYRTKAIRYGDMLDIEAYPVWDTTARRGARRAMHGISTEAQQRLNVEHRRQYVKRLIGANFGRGDIMITLTYDYDEEAFYGMGAKPEESDHIPMDEDEAAKDVTRYLERLRYRAKKQGVKDFKWICVTEEGREKYPEAPFIVPRKYHHHIILHGVDRETAEELWPYGRCNTKSLQPNRKGLNEISGYICKSRLFYRQFRHSRGLKQPTETVSDRKLNWRSVTRLAEEIGRNGREILEKLYPKYELSEEVTVRFSDYVAGAYIKATMHRRPVLPNDKKAKERVSHDLRHT